MKAWAVFGCSITSGLCGAAAAYYADRPLVVGLNILNVVLWALLAAAITRHAYWTGASETLQRLDALYTTEPEKSWVDVEVTDE